MNHLLNQNIELWNSIKFLLLPTSNLRFGGKKDMTGISEDFHEFVGEIEFFYKSEMS